MVGQSEGLCQREGEEVYDRATWRHLYRTSTPHKSGNKMKRKKKKDVIDKNSMRIRCYLPAWFERDTLPSSSSPATVVRLCARSRRHDCSSSPTAAPSGGIQINYFHIHYTLTRNVNGSRVVITSDTEIDCVCNLVILHIKMSCDKAKRLHSICYTVNRLKDRKEEIHYVRRVLGAEIPGEI